MALPDLIEIVPSGKPVQAVITAPGSKSITNRALILAALADGETILAGALWSEDTQIMVECLRHLGFMVNVEDDPDEACNRTITVYGNGGAVPPGGTERQPMELFVGNAGTAARFLAAFLCLGSGVYRLSGVPRMHERPQAALFGALRELGHRVESETGNDKLPARIFGGRAAGPPPADAALASGPGDAPRQRCRVSITESSQFASALLLCARRAGWQIEVSGENAEESPYVEMTRRMIEAFPSGGRFQIEPDASSGSYFWAAGDAVAVGHWPMSGWQIDAAFPKYLPLPGTISRRTQLGDSIMTAIVIAPFNRVPTRFTDLGRLRVQECERVAALRTELARCGAKVTEEGDTLTVYPAGPGELHGAEIETYNDHRMAMCFAILGLKVPGIKIKNPSCVKKTFPDFFQKMAGPPPRGLGATILDAKSGRKLAHEELFAD